MDRKQFYLIILQNLRKVTEKYFIQQDSTNLVTFFRCELSRRKLIKIEFKNKEFNWK